MAAQMAKEAATAAKADGGSMVPLGPHWLGASPSQELLPARLNAISSQVRPRAAKVRSNLQT